jgi:hypothetical protein
MMPRRSRIRGDSLAALEYEDATLEALRALDGTDGEKQVAACLRFVAALEATNALPATERDRGLTYLVQRGRIPISPGCASTPRWNFSPRTSTRRSSIDARPGRHARRSGMERR